MDKDGSSLGLVDYGAGCGESGPNSKLDDISCKEACWGLLRLTLSSPIG